MIVLEIHDTFFLRLERHTDIVFPAQVHLRGAPQRSHDLAGFRGQASAQTRDFGLRGLVIGMILSKPPGNLGSLGLGVCKCIFQACDQRTLQHLG